MRASAIHLHHSNQSRSKNNCSGRGSGPSQASQAEYRRHGQSQPLRWERRTRSRQAYSDTPTHSDTLLNSCPTYLFTVQLHCSTVPLSSASEWTPVPQRCRRWRSARRSPPTATWQPAPTSNRAGSFLELRQQHGNGWGPFVCHHLLQLQICFGVSVQCFACKNPSYAYHSSAGREVDVLQCERLLLASTPSYIRHEFLVPWKAPPLGTPCQQVFNQRSEEGDRGAPVPRKHVWA